MCLSERTGIVIMRRVLVGGTPLRIQELREGSAA